MPRLVSIGTKIKQCEALQELDVGQVAHRFIRSISHLTNSGKDTGMLTEPQITWIEDLWEKHFA